MSGSVKNKQLQSYMTLGVTQDHKDSTVAAGHSTAHELKANG
jgi:hypothetical protein